MPRCKTCREKFIPRSFNQKNCDKTEECKQAEIDLRQEAQQKRIDKARDKPKVLKPIKQFTAKKSRPKSRSAKQSIIENNYHKTLEIMDSNTEPKCTGCGRYQGGDIKLSHSHIISRADCKRYGRPDLISDLRNLTYHCLDFGENIGCHRRHEQRDETLLDYEDKLKFVYEICVEIENDELVNKLILK